MKILKILVVVSTSDKEKALAALMYATNAKKYGWVEDVKVVFFGPAERYIAEDDESFDKYLEKLKGVGVEARACKRIAEIGGFEEKLRIKIPTEYVGEYVSKLMDQGYTPLVF